MREKTVEMHVENDDGFLQEKARDHVSSYKYIDEGGDREGPEAAEVGVGDVSSEDGREPDGAGPVVDVPH